MDTTSTVYIPAASMQAHFEKVLATLDFSPERCREIASVFTQNSLEGIYTHGVYRFPRFVEYVQKGFVQKDAIAERVGGFNGIEQWDGKLAPGICNAIAATERCMQLATAHGIGCVALANTNHWMRGGTYGWQAAKKGFVFIGWTNTIANMPAWGAVDAKLGNNPLVIAVPYGEEAMVMDMAMSQFSFGAIELAALKKETLPVAGGFDHTGSATQDPAAIMQSNRPMPVGYWKGAGLSLLLDIVAAILSGGDAVHTITQRKTEYALSQVYIAIDCTKLPGHSSIHAVINAVIEDYKRSVPANEENNITYPGERVLQTRERNIKNGIPVQKESWEKILGLLH